MSLHVPVFRIFFLLQGNKYDFIRSASTMWLFAY